MKITNGTVALIIAFLVVGLVPFIEVEYVVGQEAYNTTETYYVEEAYVVQVPYQVLSSYYPEEGTIFFSDETTGYESVFKRQSGTVPLPCYRTRWRTDIRYREVPRTREVTKFRDVTETRTICLFEDLWIRLK